MALDNQIRRLHPALDADMKMRFSVAAAQRRHGLTREAQQFYRKVEQTSEFGPWRMCAQSELALAGGGTMISKPTAKCKLVDGATAARFLNEIVGYLKAPSRLLLAT